jgi:hypothetical protein
MVFDIYRRLSSAHNFLCAISRAVIRDANLELEIRLRIAQDDRIQTIRQMCGTIIGWYADRKLHLLFESTPFFVFQEAAIMPPDFFLPINEPNS